MFTTRGNRSATTEFLDKITSMAFAGGGAGGGLSIAAVLWQLNQAGLPFPKIKRAAGTSVGSVAALAVCLNLEPQEMFDRLTSIDFTKIKDSGSLFSSETAKRIYTEQKFYKGEVIFNHVLKLLRDKTSRNDPENITFKDLKDMGFKDLYVIATELSVINGKEGHGQKKVFSFETTPHAPVAWAIRASTAAPPYFPGVVFKCDNKGRYEVLPPNTTDTDAKLYVDGCFKENYPLTIFDFEKYIKDDATCASDPLEMLRYELPQRIYEEKWSRECIERTETVCNPHTLGVTLHWPIETPRFPLLPGHLMYEIQAIINSCLSKQQEDLLAIKENYERSVMVPRGEIGLMDFDIDKETQKIVIAASIKKVCDLLGMNFESEYEFFLKRTAEYFSLETHIQSVTESPDPPVKSLMEPYVESCVQWLFFGKRLAFNQQEASDMPESYPVKPPVNLLK